jgi:hypothetical protein
MIGFGKPVFDSMKEAEPVEGVSTEACGWALTVLRQGGELDAVVGEHGVDAVRNSFDERFDGPIRPQWSQPRYLRYRAVPVDRS